MSDLHLEISPFYVPPMQGDENTVLILSGDICTAHSLGRTVREFFDSTKRFKAVLYVPGNHEYYRGHIDKDDLKISEWLATNGYSNVHYMNMNTILIDDIAFIGATLWTDINRGDPISIMNIEHGLNDYRVIRIDSYRPLRGGDTIKKHNIHKEYLFDKIREMKNQGGHKVIAITHHAPSELSIHPQWKGHFLNSAFSSRLETEIMETGPDIMFHGHCHDNFDYILGETRVVCNPRGYAQILDKPLFEEMMNMEPVNLDDPDSGIVMSNFQRIWHSENNSFNPFWRFEI